MQLNTKNTILVLLLGFSSICFYYGFRGEESSIQTNTQKPTVSTEIVETDTGKRLETFANSGTDWGMTPFGSGKPLTEEVEEEKSKFQKPNLEWETRTINGITYRFGEGNPSEVVLSSEEINELRKKGYGYITPDTEQALKTFLEDENLTLIINKCYNAMDFSNSTAKPEWAQLPENLNMETMLIIDPETKRKELNPIYITILEPMFSSLNSPLSDPHNSLHTCIGNDFSNAMNVIKNMNLLTSTYMKGADID